MPDSTQLPSRDIHQVVQEAFDFEIISNAVKDEPLVGYLLAKHGTKITGKNKSIGIKIPDDGILTGKGLSAPKRKEIKSHTWEPLLYTGLPATGTKAMAWYDTTPDDNSGGANGPLSRMARCRFRRTDLRTPVVAWLRDMRQMKHQFAVAMRAGNTAAADMIATDITDLCKVASVEKMIGQLKEWAAMLWDTNPETNHPTDEDADLWDKQHSMYSVSGVDNFYAGRARDSETNAYLRGNRVTVNVGMDLQGLFDHMQYGPLGLKSLGIMPKLWIAGDVLFPVFKAQAAKNNLKIYQGDSIPGLPVFGQQQEAIRLNANTLIINDGRCPAKGRNGATKNALVCMDPDDLVLSFFPGSAFNLDAFVDESQLGRGKREAMSSEIRTELGSWWPNPKSLVWFEDVG